MRGARCRGQRGGCTMTPAQQIREALLELQSAAEAANNSAATVVDLILAHERSLLAEATIVKETATLLHHSVQLFNQTVESEGNKDSKRIRVSLLGSNPNFPAAGTTNSPAEESSEPNSGDVDKRPLNEGEDNPYEPLLDALNTATPEKRAEFYRALRGP